MITDKIKSLIDSIDSRGLFVLKGFNQDFKYQQDTISFSSFLDIDTVSIINSNKNIDLSELMVKFSTLSKDENKYILDYETFLLIDKNLLNLIHMQSFPIYIINNNLFFRYYPCLDGITDKTIQYIDNDNTDNTINRVYSEYEITDNIISVLYAELDVDFDIPIYDLFTEKQKLVEIENQDAGLELSFNSNEALLCSNVTIIFQNPDKIILCDTENCSKLEYIYSKLELLAALGFNIIKTKNTIVTETFDYSDYENILHRRNSSYSFRNFLVYDEPGISTNQIEINQGQVIDSIISNVERSQKERSLFNDIFVTAPTGAGKSVMFQIPAIYCAEKYGFLTIVLSPLIGLMNDQVEKISDLTDCAATINSDYTPAEKELVLNDIKSGKKSILYISPETLLSNGDITSLIGDRKIGLVVIDEAHTVATWGKSFRPDYWYLGDYINYLRTKKDYRFPIATFSATITYGGLDDMFYDVIESLKMRTIEKTTFIGSVRRDDISFDINTFESELDYRSEKEEKVVNSLVQLNKESKKTIAYFPYKRHINDIKNSLPKSINSVKYHGSIDKIEKREAIEKFKSGESKLVLATKAFGMGIDIDDIDVVYHYAPTGNLCDYVQEIGRAARNERINGMAKIDFYESDFSFIKQLHGMSRIRNSQIREVLNKIKNLYYIRKSRNFTVSPDEFSYIFPNDDANRVDTNLKTALLMIQKDFERDPTINYKPLVFKPRSLFTKGFFLISDEDVPKFKLGLVRKYAKLYARKENMFNRDHNTSTYYDGDVYVVDFRSMWEENYRDMSFPQFKRAFYLSELEGCEDTSIYKPKYLVTISANETISEVYQKSKNIIEVMKEVFNELTATNEHFKLKKMVDLLLERCNDFLTESSAVIASNNIITILNNIQRNNSFARGQIIDYRQDEDKYVIRSKAAVDRSIKSFSSELYKACTGSWEYTSKTFLVTLKQNSSNNDIVLENKVLIAQFLEAFALAKYDVRSGERPEFFIRVNSIKAIEKILNDPFYKSKMVELVNYRHNISVKMMTHFFKELKTDKERWDYIEKYFIASDDLEI